MSKLRYWIGLSGWVMLVLACARTQPDVIIVTATFPPPQAVAEADSPATTLLPRAVSVIKPSPNPTKPPIAASSSAQEYIVQAGDTLGAIAAANGVTLNELARANSIDNPDLLAVGQVLSLPAAPDDETPNLKLISDTRFVRGPVSGRFDVQQFVNLQPGYIQQATDIVGDNQANGFRTEQTYSAAAVIERISVEYSIDPRVLLALLEYRSGWLSNPAPIENAILYPMGQVDVNREGLYKQLTWAANQLNAGYYGWRYRDLRILPFEGGERLLYNAELNAGTVAIQYFMSLNNTYDVWLRQMSAGGFDLFYQSLFGDPFVEETQPLVPENLIQPDLTLPFASEEVWFYTGGPHGGWGSGSAWAAVDFAPPDDRTGETTACYTSEFPVRAIANGTIVRSERGTAVLDLDSDLDETTGWSILYLHIAAQGRVSVGQQVQAGDVIGYSSCEGGFSTATHMHIARRYNGEWIPAYCNDCESPDDVPTFVMGGWTVVGFDDQEYQGVMIRGNDRRQAEQGRLNPINRIAW